MPGLAIAADRRIAVLGVMAELGEDSEAEHRAVGAYAASRADAVIAVGDAARPIADGEDPEGMRARLVSAILAALEPA